MQHGVPHSVPILPSAARAQHPGAPWGGEGERASHFEAELEINHFPQTARWKVGHHPLPDCTHTPGHTGPAYITCFTAGSLEHSVLLRMATVKAGLTCMSEPPWQRLSQQ